MKVLQIFRSEPDETVKQLSEAVSKSENTSTARLYSDDVNWSQIVDDIFSHDKVICWW
jgi:hypothetical protein